MERCCRNVDLASDRPEVVSGALPGDRARLLEQGSRRSSKQPLEAPADSVNSISFTASTLRNASHSVLSTRRMNAISDRRCRSDSDFQCDARPGAARTTRPPALSKVLRRSEARRGSTYRARCRATADGCGSMAKARTEPTTSSGKQAPARARVVHPERAGRRIGSASVGQVVRRRLRQEEAGDEADQVDREPDAAATSATFVGA